MGKVIQFRRIKAKAVAQLEDIAFSNFLGPIQTEGQHKMLRLQAKFVSLCSWVAKPFQRMMEKFDGGTNIFRDE